MCRHVNPLVCLSAVKRTRVAIVGAGIGGLAAATILARQGMSVVVLDRASAPGGKVRQAKAGEAWIDAGATVFTMRWVFDELFAAAGASFSERVKLEPLSVLARHFWSGDEQLDLFADERHTADAIGQFAGATEARGYLRFCARARRVYELLEQPFIRQDRPRLDTVMWATGLRLGGIFDVAPFSTLWDALGQYFRDVRLRQLFARYATYCGSSPFLAPATLMLVAHVEQCGVWSVRGGMYRLAQEMAGLAKGQGADIRQDTHVAEIVVGSDGVEGVKLATGELMPADHVIANVDAAALASGSLGLRVRSAAPALSADTRSLSALTWTTVAEAHGAPLVRHNVFFARDYAEEFNDIFSRNRLPVEPTVYVCAQDRLNDATVPDGCGERLLCLVNAPARADTQPMESAEVMQCEETVILHLRRCGLFLKNRQHTTATTPNDFHRMFPATGGALYGRATHGWSASFQRPGCRTQIRGLYLAGGSFHPGAGVPMAALSGRAAAESLLSDLASISRFR